MDGGVALEGAFLSASRVSGCIEFSQGLAAIATGLQVTILNPVTNCVRATLAGHKARVNGVAWIPSFSGKKKGEVDEQDEKELVSCSVDGSVRTWRLRPGANAVGCIDSRVLSGHTGPVSAVAAHTLGDGSALIVSAGTDCTLRAWVRPASSADAAWVALEKLVLRPTMLMEALAITTLPGFARSSSSGDNNHVDLSSYGAVIAAGGVDGKVHLFTLGGSVSAGSSGRLIEAISLAGHLDWVRCLAFSHHTAIAHVAASGTASSDSNAENDHVMLASGSNDGKVRLWRLSLRSVKDSGSASSSSASGNNSNSNSNSAAGGDDDDSDDEDGARPSGDAADIAGDGARGSMLGAQSFLEHQAAAASAAATSGSGLATLQRPKTFSVTSGRDASDSNNSTDVSVGSRTMTYEVAFDAMLSGHDGWVTSVQWRDPVRIGKGSGEAPLWQPPTVISASMDKTIIVWQPSGSAAAAASAKLSSGSSSSALDIGFDGYSDDSALWSGVWEPARRIGGASGSGTQGLYCGRMSPDGGCLLAHSLNGAVHTWLAAPTATSAADSAASNSCADINAIPSRVACVARTYGQQWRQAPAVTGHFGDVSGLCWGADGAYLVSTSSDATTRVWAPYAAVVAPADAGVGYADSKLADNSSLPAGWQRRWCEIGRPQIHGYEMTSCAVPPTSGLPHRLFSAGDEKVVRVFDAPQQFLAALSLVSGPILAAEGRAAFLSSAAASGTTSTASENAPASSADNSIPSSATDALADRRAAFAYVSELALTNKAVAPEAAAQPISDRMQMDGKDAVQTGYDSAAAASRDVTRSAVNDKAKAKAHGSKGKKGGDNEEEGGDEDGEAVELTGKVPAPTSVSAAVASSSTSSAPSVVVSSADPSTATCYLPQSSSDSPLPPPLEDDLVTHTRWPEVDKLYSHPHEVVSVVSNPGGTLVASSCKARTAADATIHLWDAVTCRHHQALGGGHKLTPVTMAFSHPCGGVGARPLLPSGSSSSGKTERYYMAPDLSRASPTEGDRESDFLVSVGKDRQVALFCRELTTGGPQLTSSSQLSGTVPPALARTYVQPPTYRLLTSFTAHKRIIWGVSWAPLPVAQSLLLEPGDSGASSSSNVDCQVALFATGARDQAVKLWQICRRRAADVAASAAATSAAASSSASASAADRDEDEDGSAGGGGGNATDRALAGSGPAVLTSAASGKSDATTPSPDAASTQLTLSAAVTLPPFDSAVTSVAFAPVCKITTTAVADGSSSSSIMSALCWLAVGLESGAISLWRVAGTASHSSSSSNNSSSGSPSSPPQLLLSSWSWAVEQACVIPQSAAGHVASVRKLAWRPPTVDGGNGGGSVDGRWVLASCGEDAAVRIFGLQLS